MRCTAHQPQPFVLCCAGVKFGTLIVALVFFHSWVDECTAVEQPEVFPLKVVFATMVTVAKTKDMAGYMRMTENWYGPRDRSACVSIGLAVCTSLRL